MIINWDIGGEFQSLSVGYAHIWTSAWTAIYTPTIRGISTFTNLRTIVSATKGTLQSFTNLRTIVSATKRVIQSFSNLREIS